MLLISPYFVPDDDGEAWLIALAKRGIRVRILTNSFAATDVSPVHAGYAPHRLALVAAGVELYELKPSAYAELASSGKAARGSRSRSWLSSSRASLHAKNYIVDRHLVFIGSLNMDPRSAKLNTEMGVVLDSPALAERMIKSTEHGLLDMAYRVGMQTDGDGGNRRLTWTTREKGQLMVYDSEPGMGPLQHLGIGVLRVLPIKEEL